METKNYVTVGSVVPIQAQLHDGSMKRTVSVFILDPSANIIAMKQLTPGEGGLYYTNFFTMPDLKFVTVQAHVLEPDDNGQPYAIVSERFYGVQKEPLKEKVLKGIQIFKRDVQSIRKGFLIETTTIE